MIAIPRPDYMIIQKYRDEILELIELDKKIFLASDVSPQVKKVMKPLRQNGIIEKLGRDRRSTAWFFPDVVKEYAKKVLYSK